MTLKPTTDRCDICGKTIDAYSPYINLAIVLVLYFVPPLYYYYIIKSGMAAFMWMVYTIPILGVLFAYLESLRKEEK